MNTLAALLPVFAQAAIPGELIHWVVICIIVAAVIGIGMVAVRQSGIVIPAFIFTIAWIVLVAVIAILAIKFLVSVV